MSLLYHHIFDKHRRLKIIIKYIEGKITFLEKKHKTEKKTKSAHLLLGSNAKNHFLLFFKWKKLYLANEYTFKTAALLSINSVHRK